MTQVATATTNSTIHSLPKEDLLKLTMAHFRGEWFC